MNGNDESRLYEMNRQIDGLLQTRNCGIIIDMLVFELFRGFVPLISLLCIVSVLFIERKKPSEVISWILVITFLPIVGVILYLLIGETASLRMTSRFGRKRVTDESWRAMRLRNLKERGVAASEIEDIARNDPKRRSVLAKHLDMVRMHESQGLSSLSLDNGIRVYTNAQDKYRDLYRDIERARHSVHMVYFTFSADHVGERFIDLLAQKAREGVEVRLLYDTLGNFPTRFRKFKKILDAGGQVCRFFPLVNIIKVNYRNHRKIAVIDGKVGYTGGINISKSYIGEHRRARPWRDTHMRLVGSSVAALQERFFMDWLHCSNEPIPFEDPAVLESYFPEAGGAGGASEAGEDGASENEKGDVAVQIVSSGPDVEGEHIKYGYMKMINSAQRTIYMESPYFIPDEAFMLSLKLAVDSGVDVRLILPGIPDHPRVYLVTRSFMGDLLRAGVRVYLYNGFIHSKMIVTDGEIATIGSTNIDIRSFLLDFEINAFIYDGAFAKRCEEIFHTDIQHSREISDEENRRRNVFVKMAEQALRILSPLL